MRVRHFGCLAALAAFSFSTAAAAGGCQLQQLGALPVEMHGLRPLAWTKINGVKARFVLDTGGFYSTISRDAAAQYQLPITSVRGGTLAVSTPYSSVDLQYMDVAEPVVYLRLGNLKNAIRDYDSALDQNQKMATSLYGRGLAELRLGGKAQGQDDIAAAEKLDSGIAGRFARMGPAP